MQTLKQDLRYGVRMLIEETAVRDYRNSYARARNWRQHRDLQRGQRCLAALLALSQRQSIGGASVNTSAPAEIVTACPFRRCMIYKTRMQSLEDLTAFQTQSVNVTGGERPDRVRGAFVAANFFKVFNLNPVVGRTFVEGEDRPGAAKLAVVNEKMWRERLNADRNLGTKKLILNGESYSVIGVVLRKIQTAVGSGR